MKNLLSIALLTFSVVFAAGCGGGGGGSSSTPAPAPAPTPGTLNVIARMVSDPSVTVSGTTVSIRNGGSVETPLSANGSFALEINNADALDTRITSDASMTIALYMGGVERVRRTSNLTEYNYGNASSIGYRRRFYFSGAQFTLGAGESASEITIKIVNYTPAATIKTISYTTPFTTTTFFDTTSVASDGTCDVDLPDTAMPAPVGGA